MKVRQKSLVVTVKLMSNQKGFAAIWLLVIAIVLLLSSLFYLKTRNEPQTSLQSKQKFLENSSSNCSGKGPAYVNASPIDLSEISLIQPMGLMVGGHVTPIDHGYFYIKGANENPPRQAAVFAPFDGNISNVTRTVRKSPIGSKSNAGLTSYEDYALTIEGSCTFRIRFSNMVKLGGELEKTVGQLQPNQTATPHYKVRAGDLIGYTGLPTAYGIDVWVENDEAVLTGFVNPASYNFESWKIHMVDLFDYTKEPLKSKLLSLLERDASPRWGKIDYDIDGKLVGNWFLQGSGGYGGNRQGGEGYWDGHLSVVPDGNDPGQIDISFGNYQGQAQQFAVIGNAPDPATVSEGSGLVKYQLGRIENYNGVTGEQWVHMSYMPHIKTRAGSDVLGTVLMELLEKRVLKVEAFPDKTATQVNGFTDQAQIYER